MVVISNLGLSISVLLSFLGVFSTLFFAFFILKDTPTKKDIILTILLLILIPAGFYFK
jgi:drug/metabolite transporter (DMT)-like permease